ncbi:hypothetical protein Droror1_Dr00002831 [Drosera rotundifolia]
MMVLPSSFPIPLGGNLTQTRIDLPRPAPIKLGMVMNKRVFKRDGKESYDHNFIEDDRVDAGDTHGSGNVSASPTRHTKAEKGEKDIEIEDLFSMGKKKKRSENSEAESSYLVENVIAELEAAVEIDATLNSEGKPAINKLKKLPLLYETLSKKQLQSEFLDHGVLTTLKNWFEPLPDGSLPIINIRQAILHILTDFPIDMEQHDRREHVGRMMQNSMCNRVVMFLSKSEEEIASNRRLAKALVDKWSRPLFNQNLRFDDWRRHEEVRIRYQRPSTKKIRLSNKSSGLTGPGDLDLDLKEPSSAATRDKVRQPVIRPEATRMDFKIRPQSKINLDEIRARLTQTSQDLRRRKVNKKLQQLKTSNKRKVLQDTRISVQGK